MTKRATLLGMIEDLMFTYPNETIAWRNNVERVVELWYRSLGQLPEEAVTAAMQHWINTQPKLPHVSDIRSLITEAVNPVMSEGAVWSRRMAYFRTGRGETAHPDDAFAFAVFAEIGSPTDCGQMSPDDLRESVKWAYKRLAEKERSERTAAIETLAPALDEPRLRAVGS